jgi:hypothetical protein
MELIIYSVLRHLLTLAAGALIGVGVEEHDAANLAKAAEPVIGGAILYGAAQAWSVVDKKKRAK